MGEVRSIVSDKLSWYRTRNCFARYAEFESVDEFIEHSTWANSHGVRLFILANGSNTFFARKTIDTLVLVNRLPATFTVVDDHCIEVSSTVQVMHVLKYCEDRGLESFYYLASVPATIGGAVAMNAGLGGGGTIFDFVESLTYVENGELKTATAAEIVRSHRTTPFSGVQNKLIVSVRLRFPPAADAVKGSIKQRARWSKEHQDRQFPNCGSVFKECDRALFRWLSFFPPWGIRIPGFRAQYSRLTRNWIVNLNPSPWAIRFLIWYAIVVHRLLGKKIELEIIEVS